MIGKTIRTIRFSWQIATIAAAIALVLVDVSAGAQRGRDAHGFNEAMGLAENARLPYSCQYLKSTAPTNILWPGEQAEFTFQLTNNSDKPLGGPATVEVIPYGSIRDASDKSIQVLSRNGTPTSTGIAVDLGPKKTQTITVKPNVPERLGGYALVVDLGKAGRSFVTTFVRTFKPDPMTIHYPQITGDGNFEVDVMARLGVCPNRMAFGYTPTTDDRFERSFVTKCAKLEELKKAKLPVTVEFGIASTSSCQPLGRPRSHLDEDGAMRGSRGDQAWLPSYDADFKKLVKMILEKYGWPRGTVIGVKFMNEPWDFSSISGWGADTPRYREIYKAMAEAAAEARKEYGVEVLVGGCDSSSNTFDKLFADGKDDFLKDLDFCSLHYQGLNVPTTYKPWLARRGPNGPVQIWETEGSYAEDRVATAVATNLAAGLKHVVSIWYADLTTTKRTTKGKGGTKIINHAVDMWSPAAALGAVAHFIGQRQFKELLFRNGLPWVVVFDGDRAAAGKADGEDGTVVVTGDIGAEFQHDSVLFRNARSSKEVAELAKLKAKLAAMGEDASMKERRLLQRAIRFGGVLSASMTLANPDAKFHLYDIYGNEIPAENGKTTVPLDGRGFFLRGDGKAGSFAALLDAIRHSRVDGIEPLAKKCHDMLSPVDKDGSGFRLELTNVLNRPIKGLLSLQVEGLKVEPASQPVEFAADQTKVFSIKVSGTARPDNTYHMNMVFDAGADGKSAHEEDLHVNLIAKRTIKVDGDLKDWQGVLPQTIKVEGASGPTEAEKAWRPWEDFGEGDSTGFALGYLAYDDQKLYFAAKVADTTPDGGTIRMETRDEEQFFYPQVTFEYNRGVSLLLAESPPKSGAGAFAKNPSALLLPAGKPGERSATLWESPAGAMALDLTLPRDQRSRVALYFVDPDRFGGCEKGFREETVEVLDRKSGKVLDARELSTFGPGVYAIYEMSGDVRIKVSTTKYTPRMSAVFFDPAANPGAPPPAQGAYAKLEKFDKTTHGNWIGVYGKSGFKIAGEKDRLPAGVTIQIPKDPSVKQFQWPAGVRRFSYRTNNIVPWHADSVQIAFNAIDPARKDWLPNPPGTMPGYIGYQDTDYEYCLAKVADKFGGGTEIWRDNVPGMPHKSFIPRQGKSSLDGPVKDGKLVVLQGPTTRIVECAIPWTEIPEVKKRCDAGETIKFSFRVNDDKEKSRCMELARDRSVSKTNNFNTFRPDGGEHWANEIEFAFEK